MIKKRKCQPQNYQCGRICIKGVYVCHVDGLTGQSVSIVNRLVNTIKETVKKKDNLNFAGKPEFSRIIENGRIFSEENMNTESLDNLAKAVNEGQERIAQAENEWFSELDQLESDIKELRRDVEKIEESLSIPNDEVSKKDLEEVLGAVKDSLNSTIDQYRKRAKEGINVPNILGTGEELENFSNLKSKLISNTESDSSKIFYKFKGNRRWKAEVKEHFDEAYSLLGFNKKLQVIKNDPRPYAASGFSQDDSDKFNKVAKRVGIQAARDVVSEIYNESIRGGTVNVGERSNSVLENKSVIYHELAHHIEYSNLDIAYANRKWMESRREGPDKSLNEISGSNIYGDEEIAVPDKFISDYVGRVYENIEDVLISSEVFSVGFQHFSSNESMMDLYRKDKEHFYLTVGTILEYHNKGV